MTTRHHTRFLILLGVALVAVALFGAGYGASSYRHEQTFSEYRQKQSEQQKIQKEMQEDLSRYSRTSAAHMEAERAVAALSSDLSRVEAAHKKEFVELREAELAEEKEKALREAMRYVEVP